MDFGKALEALKAGYQVKLPSWAGYWQREGDTVAMHCKDGTMLDIREIKEYLSENNDGIQLLKK